MIISRAEVESAISAYRTSVKRKSRVKAVSYDTDRYEATSDLGAFSALASSVFTDPMYRTNLVSELQRRISEGRYFVPADEIVEKLIGRLIVEAIAA